MTVDYKYNVVGQFILMSFTTCTFIRIARTYIQEIESSSSVVRMDDSREADTAHRPSGLMDSDTFLTYGR